MLVMNTNASPKSHLSAPPANEAGRPIRLVNEADIAMKGWVARLSGTQERWQCHCLAALGETLINNLLGVGRSNLRIGRQGGAMIRAQIPG
jgi:hypothetical protein